MRGTRRWMQSIKGRPIFARMRVGLLALAVALVGLGATCQPPANQLVVSTTPGLFPAFSPSVKNYASRCSAASAVRLSINAPRGTTISVGGQPAKSGFFDTSVTRDVGQRFTIVIRKAGHSATTYNVRCIPSDFPTWTTQRTNGVQADFYVTALPVDGFFGTNYPVILNKDGVPMWWAPRARTYYADVLPNGHVVWTGLDPPGGAEEHRLDGSLVREIHTLGPADFHDLITLPNGDYVMATDTERTGVDLSAWGAPADATILDHVLEEITPAGDVVWSWGTMDHIPITETGTNWRVLALNSNNVYDPYHFNSVEYTGDGFILSFRHLNAVYKIDKSSGAIDWKLGGSHRPESLRVIGDPVFDAGGSFSGQHDARLLADGTVSVHDNGSDVRAPRAVNYRIDTGARTATLLHDVRDPLVTGSGCCGSARVLPTGDYVMGWGASQTLTEMTPSGHRVFVLELDSGAFYRAVPTPPGVLTSSALIAGMDAQFAGGALGGGGVIARLRRDNTS